MAHDSKVWSARIRQATTGEEITDLIMQLPKRELHEMSEEDREFVLHEEEMERQILALIEENMKAKNAV